MRYAAPYKPDLTALDAFTASVRDWLGGLLEFLLEVLARLDPATRRLQYSESAAQLRYAVRGMRGVLFMRTLAQFRLHESAGANTGQRPHTSRLISQRSFRRAITRGAFASCQSGALLSRIAAFEHALDHADIVLARIVERARRALPKLRQIRVIPAPAAAEPRRGIVCALAPSMAANTS